MIVLSHADVWRGLSVSGLTEHSQYRTAVALLWSMVTERAAYFAISDDAHAVFFSDSKITAPLVILWIFLPSASVGFLRPEQR